MLGDKRTLNPLSLVNPDKSPAKKGCVSDTSSFTSGEGQANITGLILGLGWDHSLGGFLDCLELVSSYRLRLVRLPTIYFGVLSLPKSAGRQLSATLAHGWARALTRWSLTRWRLVHFNRKTG